MSDYAANCRLVLSSERTPHGYKTANFRQQPSDTKKYLVASPTRDWTARSPIEVHRRFGEMYCLHRIIRTKNSARHISIPNPSLLMLFKDMIDVYFEDHAKHINTLIGRMSFSG
jgi:hypothetical protein